MTSSFSPEPWKCATTNWIHQTGPNVCTKSTCNRPIRYSPVTCSCRPTFSEFQSTDRRQCVGFNEEILDHSSRNFLLLLNRMEPPEQFMEYYSIIVPTVCPLEQGSLEKIMKTMTEYSAANYVPQLWNDAVYMELVSRESAMESITAALASGSGPSAPSLQENDEVDPILTTARSMWKYVETSVASFDPERRNPGLQLSVVQDQPRKRRIAHLFDYFHQVDGCRAG